MKPDFKATLRDVVHDYLESESPDDLEDFDLVFDDILETIETQSDLPSTGESILSEQSLGFDPGIVGASIIAGACWIAAKLLEAALKVSIEKDLIPSLDAAEKRLAKATNNPILVRKLRDRVQAILLKFAGS